MADARLQQLRRAWDEGDPESQVRLLRERMRVGGLDVEPLRLAAVLGCQAAASAMELPEPPAEPDLARVLHAHCAKNLGRDVGYVYQVAVRALVTTARFQLARETTTEVPSDMTTRLLQRLERWCLQPDDRGRKRVTRALTKVEQFAAPRWHRSDGPRRSSAAEALLRAGAVVRSRSSGEVPAIAANGLRAACGLYDVWAERGELPCLVDPALRRALHDELVPWALGLRDPLTERVAAQEAAGK